MATIYTNAYSTGTYTSTRVKIDYSGTSATATLLYTRTNDYSGMTRTYGRTFTFGGVTVNIGEVIYYGRQTDAYVASLTFPISMSGGTYYGSTSDTEFYAGSWSITIPSQGSAPTGLACSGVTPLEEGFSANVSVSGWGSGGDTNSRYRELQVWTYNSSELVDPRRWEIERGSATSGVITCDNSSASGTLTVRGNTRYTVGVYATNGAVSTGSVRVGDYVTLPYAPTVEVVNVENGQATLRYTLPADGGYYNKAISYTMDGVTTSVGTVSSSGAYTGTFYVSNLTAGKIYSLTIQSGTSAGRSVGNTVNFMTDGILCGMYGALSGKATKVDRFVGSVNGEAKHCWKIYGSVNGKAVPIMISHVDPDIKADWKIIDSTPITINGVTYGTAYAEMTTDIPPDSGGNIVVRARFERYNVSPATSLQIIDLYSSMAAAGTDDFYDPAYWYAKDITSSKVFWQYPKMPYGRQGLIFTIGLNGYSGSTTSFYLSYDTGDEEIDFD